MAARNRPRALPKEDADAHEERDLWTKIVKGLRELATMAKRVQEIEMELSQEQERLESGSFCVVPVLWPLVVSSRFSYIHNVIFIVLYMSMNYRLFSPLYVIIFHVILDLSLTRPSRPRMDRVRTDRISVERTKGTFRKGTAVSHV